RITPRGRAAAGRRGPASLLGIPRQGPRILDSPRRRKHGKGVSLLLDGLEADAPGHHWPVVTTTRKRALLLNMRSYASASFSSGNVSVIGRTPFMAEKAIVSSESIDDPDGQP